MMSRRRLCVVSRYSSSCQPAGQRLAVPGHVEGHHPVVAGDRLVGHQVAELAAVAARRVQADEAECPGPPPQYWCAAAAEGQPEVPSHDGLEISHARAPRDAAR
jgi:hypothetical protein